MKIKKRTQRFAHFADFPSTFVVGGKFSPAFSKRRRGRGRGVLVALRRARNPSFTALSFCKVFFFAPTWSKKKRERNLCFLGNKPFGRTVYLHLYKQYTTKSRACQGRRVPRTRKNARTLDERIILWYNIG